MEFLTLACLHRLFLLTYCSPLILGQSYQRINICHLLPGPKLALSDSTYEHVSCLLETASKFIRIIKFKGLPLTMYARQYIRLLKYSAQIDYILNNRRGTRYSMLIKLSMKEVGSQSNDVCILYTYYTIQAYILCIMSTLQCITELWLTKPSRVGVRTSIRLRQKGCNLTNLNNCFTCYMYYVF